MGLSAQKNCVISNLNVHNSDTSLISKVFLGSCSIFLTSQWPKIIDYSRKELNWSFFSAVLYHGITFLVFLVPQETRIAKELEKTLVCSVHVGLTWPPFPYAGLFKSKSIIFSLTSKSWQAEDAKYAINYYSSLFSNF